MHEKALLANKLAVLATVLGDGIRGGFGDLSDSTVAVLLTLHHRGPMTVTALARLVGLSQPACTRLLDRLAAERRLVRRPGPGKSVTVALTAEGGRRAAGLQARRLRVAADLLGVLKPAEQRALDGLLDRLVAVPVEGREHARHLCRFCDHGICGRDRCPIGAAATAIEAKESGHAA